MINLRYRDKGTVIHRLNPLCKLAWIGGALVLALLFNNPLYLLLLFLSTLPLIVAAKAGREWASFMKLTLYLCLAIVVINALVSYEGSHVLYQLPFRIPLLGSLRITMEAIFWGLGNSLRLLTIISAFALLNFTVHPDDLMLALIKMKLPYKSVLVTSLGTRFVPTLIEDVERITDVQRSRGLELERGNLPQKIKGRMQVLIPLLSNSLDRTVQVAEAMESRAFGARRKRTFYKDIKLTTGDIPLLVSGVSPLVLGIFMRCRGWGDYQYYPTIEGISLDGLEWPLLVVLALLLSLMPLLAFLKGRVDLD